MVILAYVCYIPHMHPQQFYNYCHLYTCSYLDSTIYVMSKLTFTESKRLIIGTSFLLFKYIYIKRERALLDPISDNAMYDMN